MRMKRIEIILIMALSVCLTGCHKPGVKYSDIRIAPTATISNGVVTIFLQGSYLGSNTWVRAKSRFEGQTLCLYGYRTTSEPEMEHEYVVNLPASVSSQSVTVIWIDPDGIRVPVPTTK
jgi:hypothetical protein